MGAEADVLCGAPYGGRSVERTNRRNGYRVCRWDMRVGSIDLKIPKLREGLLLPGLVVGCPHPGGAAVSSRWWPKPTSRGVSTRRVAGLVETLGVASLSKTAGLRAGPRPRRTGRRFPPPAARPGPLHVSVGGRPADEGAGRRPGHQHRLFATAVNGDGHREILGLDIATSEDGAGWLAFLPSLVARGLSGIQPVTSATTTPAWSTPSPPPCPASPGRGAAPTTCGTC